MDRLQAELQATYPILDIQIIGINEFGQNPAGANDLMTANRTTPWLQDVDGNANQRSDVWYDLWDVAYRDVIIINGQNEAVDVFSLTTNDLGMAANYATMREKMIDAAMTDQKPWQNPRDRFDINDDGFVVPGDVLIMINDITDHGARKLPPPTTSSLAAPFWDCNGDNFLSPLDVLQVINFIEEAHAEGEASGSPASELTSIPISLPVPADHDSFDVPSSIADIADVSIVARQEPMNAHPTARLDARSANRSQVSELASDDFWADYWPSR